VAFPYSRIVPPVRQQYQACGYEPIVLSAGTVAERVAFIHKTIEHQRL
jgi:predicted ATPase